MVDKPNLLNNSVPISERLQILAEELQASTAKLSRLVEETREEEALRLQERENGEDGTESRTPD